MDGSGVDPATDTIASYARREFDYDYRRASVDVFAAGPFELFGRRHQGMFGFNYSRYSSQGVGANPNSPNSTYLKVLNVSLADPPAVPEPDVVYTTGSENVTTQAGYYGQVRFSLTDPLTVVLGGRLSDYDYKSRTTAPNPNPTDWSQSGKARGEFTPYAGLLYDVTAADLVTSYSNRSFPNAKTDRVKCRSSVASMYADWCQERTNRRSAGARTTLAFFSRSTTPIRRMGDADHPG
jgi:outer membrane receptor for ferric coprogen and ferric-rhodotorulic acid